MIELIVVIAILGILAGVGTVAYSGYVKRANKAVDQQLVADIAYSMELAAAAGEFDQVEPPPKLGETDLGLIPVGYVSLSTDGPCTTFSVGSAEGSGYQATEDDSGVIAKALAAAFGSDYRNSLRLHYDWSGSTASNTGTANIASATFVTDVDQLWDKVQDLSSTVYQAGVSQPAMMQMLFGTNFDSSYDVISKSAEPLAYLNQSAEGRSLVSQWWSEPTMGLWLSTNQSALTGAISANSGQNLEQQARASMAGAVYARNTCMLNYIRSQMGVCGDSECLNYKDHNNERVVTAGQSFGAMTATAINDAFMGGVNIEDMFCKDCLKYAKEYCSEYAANDGLSFLEVMSVVQQADASNTSGEELGFDYYNEYLDAVISVYGAMEEAKGESGNAVIAVYYTNGKLSIDCSPVELGAFQSGETPASSVPTPATNTVNVIITEDENGNYTYTPSGAMTLDWSGQIVGYIKFYYQNEDGTLAEAKATDYSINYSSAVMPGGVNANYKIADAITITATTSSGTQGTGTISYTFRGRTSSKNTGTNAVLGISVQIKDSSKNAETTPTSYFVGFQFSNSSNNNWYQMTTAQAGYAAATVSGSTTVPAGSTVTLGRISVSGGAATDIEAWNKNGYTMDSGRTVMVLSNLRVTVSGSDKFSFNESTGVLTVSPSAQSGDSCTITFMYDYQSTNTGSGKVTTKNDVTKTLTVTVQ